MPISNQPYANVLRMDLQVVDAVNDMFMNIVVNPPVPANTETQVRNAYQKLVNALQNSPEFKEVVGQIVTELNSECTPD